MPENKAYEHVPLEKIPDCVNENSGPLTVEHVRRFKEVMGIEMENDPHLLFRAVHPLLKHALDIMGKAVQPFLKT